MASESSYLRARLVVTALVVCLVVSILVSVQREDRPIPVSADATQVAATVNAQWRSMAEHHVPAQLMELQAHEVADRIAETPSLAVAAADAMPRRDSSLGAESALAELIAEPHTSQTIRRVFDGLDVNVAMWIAAAFPSAVGNLTGVGYRERIAANRIRVAAEAEKSRSMPSPQRPWTETGRKPRPDLAKMVADDTQLIYFDPDENSGKGAWVELRGSLARAQHVGVLVPGGSAFLVGENFTRYSARAGSFVSEARGDLAMLVWAGAPFPSGWVQEMSPSWSQHAAAELTDFMGDLQYRVPRGTDVTLAGHSYGGAIVGLAEKYGAPADSVLHIASAGAGYGVDSVEDYPRPCRTRYAMMAPRDPISYVQDIPHFTGVGHGAAPMDLEGTQRLTTGYLPDSPLARDDVNRTLGSQGIEGKRIEGFHAHSEVFIKKSDAWHNILAVLTGQEPQLHDGHPPVSQACR